MKNFDLLSPDVIDIIKETHGGIVHREKFAAVVAKIKSTRNTAQHSYQKNRWYYLK